MAKLPKRTVDQLRSHLASLSPDVLVDLLVDQAARHDDLRDRLLVDAAKRGADGVDLKSVQRSLKAAIFDLAEGRYGAEYTSGDWAYEVNRAIERLDDLLAAGRAAAVVSLAKFALDALVEVMERADDSDGYISELVGSLERVHHDACVAAAPPPVELADRLFAREVDGEWDVFVDSVSRYADVLGQGGVEHFRELAECQPTLNRWVALFATAARRAVDDAVDFEARVEDVQRVWRAALGRVRAGSAVERLLQVLPGAPVLSIGAAAELIGRSFQATNEAMRRLEAADVVSQVTVGRRNRAYEARAIIDAFTALERRLASPAGDTLAAPPIRPAPVRAPSRGPSV